MIDQNRTDVLDWRTALAVTLLIQIALSMLSQAMSVLAPDMMRATGVAPEAIGKLVGLSSLGTVWFLMGGLRLLTDVGPVRLLQAGVLLSSAALLLVLFGYWPLSVVAALLVGLGYGPAPPAGSQILMSTAPPKHRALIFSIRQSGAPVGSAMAGLLLPLLAENFGWRWAMVCASAVVALTALLVEPYRRRIDRSASDITAASLRGLLSPAMVFAPFLALRGATGLKQMAFAGCTFAMVQGSVFALYVTFLTVALHSSLTFAGLAFAVMQAGGAVGRIVMGLVADRVGRPLLVIAALGLASSAMIATVATLDPAWSRPSLLFVSVATGLCSVSWNGVLLSEIARASPPGGVAQSSSAATFFIFIGYTLGPSLFAVFLQMTGSYAVGFIALACCPVAGAIVLFHYLWTTRRAVSVP